MFELFAPNELFEVFAVRTVRLVCTVRAVRCSLNMNCLQCSLFELFANSRCSDCSRISVRTVRYVESGLKRRVRNVKCDRGEVDDTVSISSIRPTDFRVV